MVKRIIFIVLLFVSVAHAQYEHEFFTGDNFSCRWDASTLALGYEWKIQRVSDDVVVLEGQTALCETHVFSIQSAGIYVFYVKAWNFASDGETVQYSVEATSLTYGMVDGVVQPWQIKVKLKPVGPLIIDNTQWGP